MPHFFPALERTLRQQELKNSMDEQGHINFRARRRDMPPHMISTPPQMVSWAAL
jgi:hypothetical protein